MCVSLVACRTGTVNSQGQIYSIFCVCPFRAYPVVLMLICADLIRIHCDVALLPLPLVAAVATKYNVYLISLLTWQWVMWIVRWIDSDKRGTGKEPWLWLRTKNWNNKISTQVHLWNDQVSFGNEIFVDFMALTSQTDYQYHDWHYQRY